MDKDLKFDKVWIDQLLSGDKQQTTRKSLKYKVGDVVRIVIDPTQKPPQRWLTKAGINKLLPTHPDSIPASLTAGVLGTIKITGTHTIHPYEMTVEELEAWARADGFPDFKWGLCWFALRYDADWMHKTWNVLGWDGWLERYFDADTA